MIWIDMGSFDELRSPKWSSLKVLPSAELWVNGSARQQQNQLEHLEQLKVLSRLAYRLDFFLYVLLMHPND